MTSVTLRPWIPPCALTSSKRIWRPFRKCVPSPAIGPDRSWIVPTTISPFVTPWAPCAPAASGPNAATARASFTIICERFMCILRSKVVCRVSAGDRAFAVHRLDQRPVLLVHQPALQLHRRGELLVLRAQLVLDQPERLDLLDAREGGVHPVDL